MKSLPALALSDVVRIATELAGDGRVAVLDTSGLICVICEVLFSKFLNSHTACCLFFLLTAMILICTA